MKIEVVRESRIHQQYALTDGTLVPGVTTVVGVISKGDALMKWAWRMGREGVELDKYVSGLASVGKLAHALIVHHLGGPDPDLDDFTPNECKVADMALQKFILWAEGKGIKPIFMEKSLVSEVWRFGGQLDIYAEIDGRKVLLDLKTSKGIFPEHLIQVSAYRELLEGNGHDVDEVRILKVPRVEGEEFGERRLIETNDYWELFRHALAIYQLQKKIKKEAA